MPKWQLRALENCGLQSFSASGKSSCFLTSHVPVLLVAQLMLTLHVLCAVALNSELRPSESFHQWPISQPLRPAALTLQLISLWKQPACARKGCFNLTLTIKFIIKNKFILASHGLEIYRGMIQWACHASALGTLS